MKYSNSENGVSLIELIVVVTIIAILSLVVVEVSWLIRDSKVSEIRDRLLADLENMKIKSIAAEPHAVFLFPAVTPNYYQLHLLDPDNGDQFIIDGETTFPNLAWLSGARGDEGRRGYNCDKDTDVAGNDSFCLPDGYRISWTG